MRTVREINLMIKDSHFYLTGLKDPIFIVNENFKVSALMIHYDMLGVLIMYDFVNLDSWNSRGVEHSFILPRTQRY